jgi:thiol-disulfide isomerase/thioredoxin
VTRATRFGLLALLALAPIGIGCADATPPSTSINSTPDTVLSPKAADEAKPATTPAEGTKTDEARPEAATAEPAAPAAVTPVDLTKVAALASPADEVALVPVKFDAMRAQIAAKKAKLTMVDAWATWCAPCKENFPHVVEMNRKYAEQGLNVASLSLDDPTEPTAVEEATQFLRESKATFTNFLLDETQEDAFDKLKINGIPAVFLFGPDGKELKRYTMDDPDNQFTYEQVERDVAAMLQGKPAPTEAKADRPKADGANSKAPKAEASTPDEAKPRD